MIFRFLKVGAIIAGFGLLALFSFSFFAPKIAQAAEEPALTPSAETPSSESALSTPPIPTEPNAVTSPSASPEPISTPEPTLTSTPQETTPSPEETAIVPAPEISPTPTDSNITTDMPEQTAASPDPAIPPPTTSETETSSISSTITSTETGGLWSDPSTWVGGIVPGADDSVVIATSSGHSVILDANFSAKNLTISSGALEAGGNTLTIAGDLINQSSFLSDQSTVIFNDNSQISHIYGTNTFNNLTCLTPGKTIIFEANTLTTVGGTLTIEGDLENYVTLKSSIESVDNMFGIYINSVSDARGSPYLKNISVYYSHAYGPITPITAVNEYIPVELNIGWDVTYTTSQSGDWNVASTWGNAGVPGNADTAVITASWIVTVTANATVSALNFGVAGTGAVNGVLKINSGVQLTVTNAITVYGTAAANTTATIQDGTGAGTITCATVQIGGTVTPSGVRTNKLISNITTFTASGTTTLTSYRSSSSYNNPMFDLQSGTFSGTTITMTSANSNTTLTFTMANGAHSGTLKLSSTTPWTVPSNGVTTLNTAGNTVEYTGAGAVAIRVTPYYNLTLSGASGTYTGAVTSVSGTLTMSGGVVWTQDAITTTLVSVALSGTASLTVGANMTISDTLTISGGTFNANTKTLSVTGLTTVNGGTYQPSTAAQTLTGGLTFSSGTITQGTGAISIAGNMTVSGSPTFTKNASGKIIFNAGTANQTLTSSGIDIGIIQISANGGNTTLTLQDALDADDITIDANQTLDTKNGTNAAISASGTWLNSGTFTAQNGTVTFDGSSAQTLTSGGSHFYHVTFSNSTAGPNINLADALAIDANVTLTQNTTMASTNTAVTITGTINGAKILSIDAGNATVTFGGIIGGVTPITSLASIGAGAVTINTTAITTRDVASNNVSFTGAVTLGANLTITTDNAANDGNITFSSTINGNFTLTLNAGTGGTITITGAVGAGTALGAITITNCSSGTFSSTINAASYTNTAGSVTMADNVVLTGNFSVVAGTLTAPSTGKSITLSGNWSQSGTFNANGGTVILNGANQKIFGSTTFYNLTKDVSGLAPGAYSLFFQQSNTQAIAANGTLTLKGASDKILSLRGCDALGNETAGNPEWGLNVNLTGTTLAIDYVDVKDSDASAGKTITQTNSTSSGNNLNWSFDSVPPTVVSVAVQTGLTVNIVFSEPMGAGVTTASNYTLSGTGKGSLADNPNTAALVAGNTYVLTWNAGEMFNGGDITITVANAQDLGGNPVGAPNSGTHTGGAIGTAPTVSSVAVQTGLTVNVVFSESMGTGVTTASNYTVSGAGKGTLANNPNTAVLVAGSTYVLTWSTGEMLNGGNITITVANVQDLAGNVLGAPNSGTHTGGAIGTAPTVSSVAVQTGLTVNVVFSESMGSGVTTAANYTVSGTGKGTLANNPNTAVLVAGSTYVLTWSAGEMVNGGNITITVANVQDLAANPIGAPNSGTHAGGAIGTAPTVSTVAVQTGLTVNIIFSEAMGVGVTTASNYTLSGTGKGSLANNPNTAVLVAGNTYVLTWNTGEMVNGGNITITVANAQDLAGNAIGAPNSGTHAGGAIGTAPTVSTVAVQTGLTVNIVFSEAMGAGVTTASNYTVSGTGQGTLANNPNTAALVGGNTYVLTWNTGEMVNGGNITITVANVQDLAGNTIGAPNSGTHASGAIGVAPTVNSVAVQTGLTVNIVFSEAMGAGVTTASNYTVSGTGKGSLNNNPDTAVLVAGNTYVLTWNAGEMFNGGNITITVANVQDLAGNTIGTPNSGTHTAGGIGTAPTVSSVAVQTGLTVNIVFSEVMGIGVTTAANYTISGAGKGNLANNPNTSALVAGNTYVLTWNTGEMVNGGNVIITVANVQDLAGNVIGAPNSGTHVGGGIGVAPTVTSVAVQTGLTVNIVFSETMGTGVTTASNYTISGTGKGSLTNNPNTAALVAGNTYVLTWNAGEMVNGGNITITVANVQDLAGNAIGTPNSGTHAGGAIGTAPTVSSVAVQTGLTVNIVFSETMGTGVTTASNYTISGAGKGSLANNPNTAVLVAGNTYVLTWNAGEMFNGGNITITVANVQDTAGNVIGAPNSGTHNGGAIGTAPTVLITDPTADTKANSTKVITFTDDETTNPQCSVDNLNWTACTSGVTTLGNIPQFAGLVEGNTFTLYLKDTDAAGNIGTNNVANITKDTTAPTVSSVAVQTGLTVNVVFSESMGAGATTAANYTLSGTGQGGLANNPNTAALVAGSTYVLTWIAGEMVEGGDITITVANIQDLAGNAIGVPNSGTHVGGGISSIPTVSSVAVQTGLTVNIVFSEAMGAGVTTASNYTLSGTGKGTLANNPNTAVLVAGNTYVLTWVAGEMVNGGNITITAANVQDLAGNPIGNPNSGTHTGGGIGTAPTVSSVAVQTGLTVNIVFSETMGTGVTTASNYTISGTGKGSLANNPNTAVLVAGNTYVLTWSAGEMVNGGNITITVANTQDLAGNVIGAPNSGTHAGGGVGVAPTVSSVAVQTGLTVNIVFSESMGAGVTTASNYTVSGTGKGSLANNPNTAALVAGNTYVLTWNVGEMFNGGNITITVANVQDLAGNAIGAPNSGTHVGGAIGTSPTVSSVAVQTGLTVNIVFSEAMGTGATTATNYSLSGTGQGGLANNPNTAVLVAGSTYVLTWVAGEMVDGGDITITVANVQDLAGNLVGAPNFATHVGGGVSSIPTVSSVAVQTGLTVNIVFSESMGAGVTTASNYTVSGTGKGTLANNPNTAALVAGSTYVLTWLAGEMVNGGNITITVANVQDLAGNGIGSPNSGTHTGGGIGVAPTVSSVAVQTGLTINIIFSESMGAGVTTASNYTVSGTGKGTLANNPNTAALVGGNTYVLTWNAGEMFNGGNITITVANAQDLAGNIIGAPNSGTHAAGGIGTAPTVASVAVQTGLMVNIVFSEAMGAGVTTASNYTISGTGKGTLANNPNTAALVGGNTYILTWNAGEMFNGGNITITVANVQDLAGNTNGVPNSATHNGGAIGVAPTVTITAPVTGSKVNASHVITFTDNETTNPQCSVDNLNWTACTSGVTTLGTIPQFAGLVEGNPFTLYLRDTDAAGNIGTNNVANITKDTTPPVPGNLGTITTADIMPTTLTLNWTKATDAVTLQANITYRVYQSSNNDIDTVVNIEANGTPLNAYTADINTLGVINLLAGTQYYFNIIAMDEAGNKVAYTMKLETTSAASTPDAPTNLSAAASDGRIDLTWLAPLDDGGSPITNYKIFRDTGTPATTLHDTIGNLLSYIDLTDVINGILYFYRIKAVNAMGDSIFSNEDSATPTAAPASSGSSGLPKPPKIPTPTPAPAPAPHPPTEEINKISYPRAPIPTPTPSPQPTPQPSITLFQKFLNFLALILEPLTERLSTADQNISMIIDKSTQTLTNLSEHVSGQFANLTRLFKNNIHMPEHPVPNVPNFGPIEKLLARVFMNVRETAKVFDKRVAEGTSNGLRSSRQNLWRLSGDISNHFAATTKETSNLAQKGLYTLISSRQALKNLTDNISSHFAAVTSEASSLARNGLNRLISSTQALENFSDNISNHLTDFAIKTSNLARADLNTLANATSGISSHFRQDLASQVNGTKNTLGRLQLGIVKFYEIVFIKEPNHISNVAVTKVAPEEVTITWDTNHLSTSQVNFGSAVGIYEQTEFDGTQTRRHSITLKNLNRNTTYYYELISKNGDYAVDAFRTFTTPQ